MTATNVNDIHDFKLVLECIEAIANEASSTRKKEKIALHASGNPLFVRVVQYALNPYLTFKMKGDIKPTPKALTNFNPALERIFHKLDTFATQAAVTKEQRQAFHKLVADSGEDNVKVVNFILNKDLRCGASVKTFKAASFAFSGLPEHFPMKGIDKFDKFYKSAGDRTNICWSYKLDGTRTWAVVDDGRVLWLSSNGHELHNFHVFDDLLLQKAKDLQDAGWVYKQVTFDGEVVNVQGDFSKHMSQFRRLKEMDASGFRFRMFDAVPEIRTSKMPFHERYQFLKDSGLTIWQPGDDDTLISLMEHLPLNENPKKIAKHAVDVLGLEGIMCKLWSAPYEHKRTNHWCKIKFFHTLDLMVVDKVEGTGKHAGSLGALVVDNDGIMVEVGSGYTDAERKEFWENPPKCIEVKYQEMTPAGSLRFPTFVRVRDDKA